MFNCFFKSLAVIALAMLAHSCSNTNNKPIIKFSNDGSSIIIKNIDQASLLQVKNAYQDLTDSVNLISVLIKPGDLDQVQDDILIAGKVEVLDDSIVFKPEKPFERGKTYLVENYVGVKFARLGNLLNGTAKRNLQPQKQILKR